MKHRTFRKWGLGAAFTTLCLTAFRLTTSAEPTDSSPAAALDTSATTETATAPTTPAADTAAPAQLVSSDKPLPQTIKPSGPVSEVIKLANSGLAEPVMLAYVTNSVHTFNLSAEDIIYLNDIGVPGTVVTAMIQRDVQLRSAFALAANPPPAQPEPSLTSPPGTQAPNNQAPEQVVPQPADGSGNYAVEAPLTPPGDASGELFYDSLAPYGSWVDVQGYGRCWQPTVVVINSGWQPYYNCGHWVYSDCGWYWLSDYSWGWGPFHYGSWFRHANLGWCWQPGRVWGPSWVSWRYGDHYCGWAPLPPGAGFVAGIGLTFHGHPVRERDDFGLRPDHYHFVAWDHFNDRHFRPDNLPAQEAARAFHESVVTTRITGDSQIVINNGLPVSRVAAATHRPVQTVALRDVSEPVRSGGRTERFEADGHNLAVYRPRPDQVQKHVARETPAAAMGSASAAPWVTRSGYVARPSGASIETQGAVNRPAAPLIMRGAESSVARESVPPNSLVVIGRNNNGRSSAALQPAAVSAPSARPAPGAPTAETASQLSSERRTQIDVYQNQQRNWMGTVSSSPQPSWFSGNSSRPAVPAGAANPAPRPEVRSYTPATRQPVMEVPRYSQSPAFVPQQRSYSYSPPVSSAPARAPVFESRSAPPAPAAPASSASSHSRSADHGGR